MSHFKLCTVAEPAFEGVHLVLLYESVLLAII